jgi:allantoin racemase
MRILIVNPNTTVSMTDAIRQSAERYASPGTEIFATQATLGPESIEGYFEGYLSAVGVFDCLQKVDFDFDALVMAGFGEPGREGAQELLDVPVFDITECAAHVACLLGWPACSTAAPQSAPPVSLCWKLSWTKRRPCHA